MAWNYLVEIDRKYQEKIVFESGVELYQDVWTEQEEKVTLFGRVVIAPPAGAEKLGIGVGDVVYFRYDVVGDSELLEGTTTRKYYNEVWIDEQRLWKVDASQIFAVKRGDEIRSVGDYVIGVQHKRQKWQSSLLIATELATEVVEDELEVVYEGSEFAIGTTLFVQKKYLQHYNLHSKHGDEVVVCPMRYVVGIIEPEKAAS